jgi:cytochrome P450
MLLLLAGFETTVNQIGTAVLALLALPDEWHAVIEERSLAGAKHRGDSALGSAAGDAPAADQPHGSRRRPWRVTRPIQVDIDESIVVGHADAETMSGHRANAVIEERHFAGRLLALSDGLGRTVGAVAIYDDEGSTGVYPFP